MSYHFWGIHEEPEKKSPKPACPWCDNTGYKDYAGFAMDPCDHPRHAVDEQGIGE